MRTLIALVAAVLACALARPLVPTDDAPPVQNPKQGIESDPIPPRYLSQYILPQMLLPRYQGYDDNLSPIQVPDSPDIDPLDEEVDIMDDSPVQETDPSPYYYGYIPRWIPRSDSGYMAAILADSHKQADNARLQKSPQHRHYDKLYPTSYNTKESSKDYRMYKIEEPTDQQDSAQDLGGDSKSFALSPLNKDYYKNKNISVVPTQVLEDRELMIEQRMTRQNPNWSKQKSLVAENLDRLRTGFTQGDNASTDKPKHIHVLETPSADPAESIYGVALIAAIGAALAMAFVGFLFGWYTLSKKAKAAADVDYPAYGVTGPTSDVSGDRKLAQSAHMYHYQHQKQQIIAMERNGVEHGNGSVSDPDSEEENEEGDYTVYECPGFATTGDMEVKNPLFKEEATPATPAKSVADKAQPRE